MPIHFDGRPISSDAADESLNAILECWNPAVYTAEAVTDALLGRLKPSGKMPLSTARCAGQIPVYYTTALCGPRAPASAPTIMWIAPIGHAIASATG